MFQYHRLHDIEKGKILDYLDSFICVKEFQRLKDVGMACGLEYTSFPFFKDLFRYTRYDHSIGVSLLLTRFTDDIRIIIAGLYHDIATPCFSHVIDFLNHDNERQESTEEKTSSIIHGSEEIQKLLQEYHLKEEDINDYHKYPLSDNDTPRLSADRLEYHIGNALQYHNLTLEEIKDILDDLTVLENEEGQKEIGFRSQKACTVFLKASLFNSGVYIADIDRYSMEILSRILKEDIDLGIITLDDLYGKETDLISELESDPRSKKTFDCFRSLDTLYSSPTPLDGYLQIKAKKRYVNPLVKGKGRILDLDSDLRKETDDFLRKDFSVYLKGKQI